MARNNDGGLPRYDEDYHPEHAYKFCILGATNADLGRMFGVSERTVEHWMTKHKEFKKQIHAGRELADADVAMSMFRNAKGWKHRATKIFNNEGRITIVPYTEKYPPNFQAGAMWLTNRQPKNWKNKTSNEIGGPDGGPLEVRVIRRVIIDPKE